MGHEYCHRIPFLLALLKMRNRPSWLLVFHRGNRELKMTWRRKYALNPIYTTNLSQILSLISINRLLFFNCSNVHPFWLQDSRPPFDIHAYGDCVLDKLSLADDENVLSFGDVVCSPRLALYSLYNLFWSTINRHSLLQMITWELMIALLTIYFVRFISLNLLWKFAITNFEYTFSSTTNFVFFSQ